MVIAKDWDGAQQSELWCEIRNLFVYMHMIKYLFIDLSYMYYPVSFKLGVFEKLTNH